MDGREDKSHDMPQASSSRRNRKRKKDNGDQTPQVSLKKRAQTVRSHFYFIKENVGSHWKDLAFHLGFENADIENIPSKSGCRDDKSCCMKLLETWLERNGVKATIEALREALSRAKLQSIVDGLEERPETAAQSQLQTANIQPPDGLEVVETENDRIKLRWDPVDSDQLFGYRVEKSIPNPEAFQLIWESTHGSLPVLESTELEVDHLEPYHAYNFRVKSAIYIEGNVLFSKGSTPKYVTTRKQNQPFRPRRVMVSRSSERSVSLRWAQPLPASDVDPTSYEYVIEMRWHAGGKHTWTECCRTKEQTCTVTMEHSGEYYFRVSAINTDSKLKETISSLPQEKEDPKVPVHIESQSGWLQLSVLQLLSLKARWPIRSTNATSQEPGSIIYVISCLDLDGLRELWMNYNLGKVKTFFQDLFALASKVSDTELDIKIDEQDFYACRQHLLMTCAVDGGRRVVRIGDSVSRGAKWGLSEDYPVYCKPISHRTTCSQLDFLDLAASTMARQPTAVEKAKMQAKQLSAYGGLVKLAAVKPVPDLPVHLYLSLEQHPTASGQSTDVKVLEQILDLERTQFTADVLRSPGYYNKMRELFLSHKAFLKAALAHDPATLLLTFLRQTDVDRFFHNHYRVGEGTLSQQLSHILISDNLQDKVKGAQLIVGLQVKNEDYTQVRNRLGQGLDRTMSVDNLMALTPPTKHAGSSKLRGLDLASREDLLCKGLTDDGTTLHFTVRQVQTALQTSRVHLKEQLKGLYQTARQDTEAMVRSLSKEVTLLKQKDETAQKILLEHKEQIRQLQDTDKTKDARIEELVSENTKLSNQLPNLHGELRSLREKDETSQKVLLEKKLEIQHLQNTNKEMAAKVQDLSAKHALEGKSGAQGESSGKGKDSKESKEGQSGSKDIEPGPSLKESLDNAAVLLVQDSYGASEREIPTNRQVVETLREHRPDIPVFSTVLQATEQDKQDAQQDGVELLLPKLHPDDPRTDPSLDWLTFDHRLKYPHLPSNVMSIVGHTNSTSRAAVRIKKERYPAADTRVILFTTDIPEETEYYKGDEKAMGIGKKEDSILQDAQEADVVFSLGSMIFDHFQNQFRAIPTSKRPQHVKFVPRPSKIFEDAEAEYKEAETMVVLSIGRVKGVEKLKGYDLAAETLSIVADKIKIKWHVIAFNKDDFEATKAILEHCKSANLQIIFLPYGTQKDICREMIRANLVLMPSRAEPFGLVGLEAIAAGVPVLVSSKSGLADFIHEHVDELHHSIVDVDGLDYEWFDEGATVRRWADAIERVLKHNRAEFKTAARGKQQLLSSKYWEEFHLQFVNACVDEGEAAVSRRVLSPGMAGQSTQEHTQSKKGRSTAAPHLGETSRGSEALEPFAGPPLVPVVVEILAQVLPSVKTPEDMLSYATAMKSLSTMDLSDEAQTLLKSIISQIKTITDLHDVVEAIEQLEKFKGIKVINIQEG